MVADALAHPAGRALRGVHSGLALPWPRSSSPGNATERTLSIHHITHPAARALLWATVCATFALGTATGDLTATTLHLGFLASGILFAVVIARTRDRPPVRRAERGSRLLVRLHVTRPLAPRSQTGWGFPRALGGLNWGRGTVAVT